jgi:hypothetical protein
LEEFLKVAEDWVDGHWERQKERRRVD